MTHNSAALTCTLPAYIYGCIDMFAPRPHKTACKTMCRRNFPTQHFVLMKQCGNTNHCIDNATNTFSSSQFFHYLKRTAFLEIIKALRVLLLYCGTHACFYAHTYVWTCVNVNEIVRAIATVHMPRIKDSSVLCDRGIRWVWEQIWNKWHGKGRVVHLSSLGSICCATVAGAHFSFALMRLHATSKW